LFAPPWSGVPSSLVDALGVLVLTVVGVLSLASAPVVATAVPPPTTSAAPRTALATRLRPDIF
jgi:hypothetical protein